MTSILYSYSKAAVNVDRLTLEIQQSSIVTALDYITFASPTLSIYFKATLSVEDQATLDTLVANHAGEPLPSAPPPTNAANVPQVEVVPRLGEVDSKGISICTHDFADKTTWYQKAIQVSTPETLTDTGDGLNFQSANPLWISIGDPKTRAFYGRNQVPKRDGTFGSHAEWAATIFVDGVAVTAGFVINYALGKVTFDTPQSGVVTATYWHINGVDQPSEWLLVAPPTQKYWVEKVKAVASDGVVENDTLRFEIWASGDPASKPYMTVFNGMQPWSDEMFDAGFGKLRYDYRDINDFSVSANEAYTIGGKSANQTAPLIIWNWNYIEIFYIDSALGMTFRAVLLNDEPYTNTDRAVATFYMQQKPS